MFALCDTVVPFFRKTVSSDCLLLFLKTCLPLFCPFLSAFILQCWVCWNCERRSPPNARLRGGGSRKHESGQSALLAHQQVYRQVLGEAIRTPRQFSTGALNYIATHSLLPKDKWCLLLKTFEPGPSKYSVIIGCVLRELIPLKIKKATSI